MKYSAKKDKRTAATLIINSGDKIISQWNYTVLLLFFKRQTVMIHNNAVEAGIVEKPEDYLYSSAKDYVVN